jgi:hydroxymethylpyrimidine kinase/phosphomethylpyrimidine kinase/thiamine-phosphate diphosphorylase
VVVIGGTDPSGAGLSTDIQVAQSLGCSALPVVTAVTAQRHDRVLDSGLMSAEHVSRQLKCIDFSRLRVVKIGMLGTADVIQAVAGLIPAHVRIVLDPVLGASSGATLLSKSGLAALKALLIPRATLITPNIAELKELSDIEPDNEQTMRLASQALLALGAGAVFAKGGHRKMPGDISTDMFTDATQHYALSGTRWPDRVNVRGTGCALATAIACFLNQGARMDDALVMARAAISQSIDLAIADGGAYLARHRGLPAHIRYVPEQHRNGDSIALKSPNCGTLDLGIYPVVDSLDWIKKLVPLGITTIQLRIKQGLSEDIEKQILDAVRYCTLRNIRLFINDHWALAIKHGAYGVHLGQEDIEAANLPAIADAGLRLGLSSHCWSEVARALAIKPSYLALGPIYETSSKQMPWVPQGAVAVKQWVERFDSAIPLVAIGGINLARARVLKQTGVGSVAMISAITQAPDYKKATRDLLAVWAS